MMSWKFQPRFNFITLSWTWSIPNHWQIGKFLFQALWVHESMLARKLDPNRIRIPESTIIQNLDLNHKIKDRGHIHVQVQYHWSDNLSICQRFGIDQVQDCVMKLNHDLSFQDTMTLSPNQYGWENQKWSKIGWGEFPLPYHLC